MKNSISPPPPTIFATSPALYQVLLARLVGGELAMERAEPPQTIISGN